MDGILLYDKPSGPSSHDAVMAARRALGTRKIGHTGTLDPLASGLLILCVGKATKLVRYLVGEDKEYAASIILGYATATDDITGEVTERMAINHLDDATIKATLLGFLGKSLQRPPAFSAIKVHGAKLYELARKQKALPEVEPREIMIHSFSQIAINRPIDGEIHLDFTCVVSKGTYIRALARDLGTALGTGGTLAALRRTRIGEYSIATAVTAEALAGGEYQLLDPLPALKMPRLRVGDDIAVKVDNGAWLPKALFSRLSDTLIVDQGDRPLAIYHYDKEKDIMRMSVKLA